MKSLLLIVLFITTSVFAKGELLHKFARTGRVDPQESYEKDCLINQNGLVEVSIQLADAPPTEFARRISPHQVLEIRRLLFAAKDGEIVEGPLPCDVGTRTLEGFLGGQQIELDVAVNCRSHRVNQSPVVTRLKAISNIVCTF